MIATFEWNGYFETGLADVDAQHRHLVDLLNLLGSQLDSGSTEQIDALLLELAQYTVQHFDCEESLMAEHRVDPAHQDHHRQTHQRFVAQVQSWLATRHDAGQLSPKQLVHYLADWLVFHILGEDQAMGRQIAAIRRGVAPRAAHDVDRVVDDPRTEILLNALRRLYGGLLERNEQLILAFESLKREHASLEQARNDLAALNASLEQRVLERTQELQVANERLRQEQDQLVRSEKMAAVGLLAAGFAHEINTPVGIAVGTMSQFGSALASIRHMSSAEEVREEDLVAQLDVLDESSSLAMANLKRAADLVGSFKRSSIDQASEHPSRFALRSIIDDDLLTLAGPLRKAQARVRVDCPSGLELFDVPGLYHQLFTNLVLNALQHAFDDSRKHAEIHIAARLAGARLHIEVADNGLGMSAEVSGHIFQPFFTTRRARGGTGLGLYICYDIATQRLGGTIVCESAPGQGSRFRIDLPAAVLQSESATP